MNECESCAYYTYDEEYEEFICERYFDEDEYARLVQGYYKKCPFYRDGDEYKIAKRQ